MDCTPASYHDDSQSHIAIDRKGRVLETQYRAYQSYLAYFKVQISRLVFILS